jgi:tetratricopeptide (TPR) repeat protein
MQEGDFAESLKQYSDQAAIIEGLILAEPRTPRWRYRLADTQLYQVEVLLPMGRYPEAREQLGKARALLDELVAHDAANRRWQGALLHARLLEATLLRQANDWTGTARVIGEVRPQLEKLSAAEPSDRVLVRWNVWALRLGAQAGAVIGQPDALAEAARAVELGEKLIHDDRATEIDLAECAFASLVRGEIALQSGDATAARLHWEHAGELIATRLPGTKDWRLLDPAARAALRLGRIDTAHALLAQLTQEGYVPLDPWPEANRLDGTKTSPPKSP